MKIIDFGNAIDLKSFDKRTRFEGNAFADSYAHPKVLEGDAWGAEVDAYGVACCLFTALYGRPMRVRKNDQGEWLPTDRPYRYWQREMWENAFRILINEGADRRSLKATKACLDSFA